MKRILIIDNTFDPPHGCPEIRKLLEIGSQGFGPIEVISVRAPDSQIPEALDEFHGAVLSGSKTRIEETAPWIEKEMEAIKTLYEMKIPTLGICYGEQLIARAFGAQTGIAEKSEFGWAEVEVRCLSPILEGLPSRFYPFEYHSDEVISLPENFRLTASSRNCRIQAFDMLDAPIWGVQFHPERGLVAGEESLVRRKKQGNGADCFLNPDKGTELYRPGIGEGIFQNFMKQVWARL